MKKGSVLGWMLFALMVVSVGLLSSCDKTQASAQEPITAELAEGTIIEIKTFEWRIVSEKELKEIYIASGKELYPGQELKGFSGVDLLTRKAVVYTTSPKYVDDDATTTLGHEVIHLAVGPYHTKKEKR